MNKKHLTLIGVVVVLIIIVVTVVFAQTLIQNNNTTSSLSSSVTSSSPLTQDEITTLKADSLELEIKDLAVGYGVVFNRIDSNVNNATVITQYTERMGFVNYTIVSETVFLGDINNCLITENQRFAPSFNFSVTRIGNTFYLTINADGYPQYNISVSCTP